MNPISLIHLYKLLLPSPRNYSSATGPRSKTQPTATAHTQGKHTRHGCWQPKPVMPVSETGQTASVGLSLTQAGETGQTGSTRNSLLTVDFGTPSYKFNVNICTHLIF
jgi:hypothetical protein